MRYKKKATNLYTKTEKPYRINWQLLSTETYVENTKNIQSKQNVEKKNDSQKRKTAAIFLNRDLDEKK
jgi:hypothetical protein